MAITDDAVAFITNQIGVIISLILTIIMGFRWLQRENKKHSDNLEIKLLGKDKDGKGGIVNDLRMEAKAHVDRSMKDVTKDIRYMARDMRRMEKTLEVITRGRYVSTKSKVEEEERSDNSYYDDDVIGEDR